MNDCPHCPDGHRKPGSKPMAVTVGSERDRDGQPTTLHVEYTNLHHVSESEAEWLRSLIQRAAPEITDELRRIATDRRYSAEFVGNCLRAALNQARAAA